MQDCQKPHKHEKNNIIEIVKNSHTLIKEYRNNQYDLKLNFFDPSQSSPPNDFMIKLKIRMNTYESFKINELIEMSE